MFICYIVCLIIFVNNIKFIFICVMGYEWLVKWLNICVFFYMCFDLYWMSLFLVWSFCLVVWVLGYVLGLLVDICYWDWDWGYLG